MRTTFAPETLANLAAQGRTEAGRSPFVDPCVVATSKRILRDRGEEWAASVLMRPNLSARRSVACPEFPWFEDGEMEALVLADRAEWEQFEQGARP